MLDLITFFFFIITQFVELPWLHRVLNIETYASATFNS